MYKAAFFDIDGTLLSSQSHQISPGTIRAFDMLHRNGVRTFVSSGRPKSFIPQFPVTFDGYITMTGGLVIVDDKVLLRHPIRRDDSLRWIDYAKHNDLPTMCFLEQRAVANRIDETALEICRQLDVPQPNIMSLDDIKGYDVYQFIALCSADADADIKALLPHCRLPRWHPLFTDVVPADNSKAAGMEAICHHFGIEQNETLAFGDGNNDMEMIEWAGTGVAMGNASPELKAVADMVTTSVDDEGIFNAIKQLIQQ